MGDEDLEPVTPERAAALADPPPTSAGRGRAPDGLSSRPDGVDFGGHDDEP